jgi:HAD superfamily hydrolase (TIGR01509 family)
LTVTAPFRHRGDTGPRSAPAALAEAPPPAAVPRPAQRLDLDSIASRWQLALDAGDRALQSARRALPAPELDRRRRQLALERQLTAELLAQLAHVAGSRAVPWLSPVPVTPTMLGLPSGTRACIFDVDEILIDAAALHLGAWSDAFDDFLLHLSDRAGRAFVPFDRRRDRVYIDGRSRIGGVHAFLASRGIRLLDGAPGDTAGATTAWALAHRKGEALERRLATGPVHALPGARRYLEAAGHAGLGRAVVSASATTWRLIELAGLGSLLEACVDASVVEAEGLQPRPAPDLLLAACRRLGVSPTEAVTFAHSDAGVAAGRAAGLTVVAVRPQGAPEPPAGVRLVPALRAQLDPQLACR